MKKTQLLLGGLLVVSTILASSINFSNHKEINEDVKVNEEIRLAVAEVDKLEGCKLTLLDSTDNAYINLEGTILPTYVETLKTVKFVISNGAEVHEFNVNLNNGSLSLRVGLKDLLERSGTIYEMKLVDETGTLITNLQNKNLARGTNYFFNKASNKFFRVIDQEGLKIQPLDGVLTDIGFKKEADKIFMTFEGIGNEFAKGTMTLKGIGEDNFVRDPLTNILTAKVDITNAPQNKANPIDLLNPVGMLRGPIKFRDAKNPFSASPYFEAKKNPYVIDNNNNIFRLTGKKSDCYNLTVANNKNTLITGIKFEPTERGEIFVSGVANSTVKSGTYELGLVGPNDVVIEKTNLVVKEDGYFEHTFSNILTKTKYNEKDLYQVRLIQNGSINKDVGFFDEYLDWGWINQSTGVKTVNFKTVSTGNKGTPRYAVAIEVSTRKFDMANEFKNVELSNEIGFTYRLAMSQNFGAPIEIVTISNCSLFLDYKVPAYLDDIETGIIFTKNVDYKEQTFTVLPEGMSISTYKPLEANVKDNWTVKLSKLDENNLLHTNFKYAPYYKDGDNYIIGKYKVASFYSSLDKQLSLEENVVNKKAIALTKEQYKA